MDRSRSILKKGLRREQWFFEQFRSKPFWIWDKEQHKKQHTIFSGKCCFNHMIGLPVKNSKKMPFFDYEQEIFDSLQEAKHVWIKKATGLGITEFMLRYIAWLCLRDDKLKGSHMCLVTGPRIDLAITLVERIKGFFSTMRFNTKETVVLLNGVKIEAFPSHHLDAMRGLPNVSFILLDEADFFPVGQQQEARAVSERYIAKSDPHIVMVSTPNAPEGLFEQIEKESNSIYHKIQLPYSVGEGLIYSREELLTAMASPSFEREYNLAYIGQVGNLFTIEEIQRAVELGKESYNPSEIATDTHKVMALDPSWSSSKFGYCIAELGHAHDGSMAGQINILMADELEKPMFQEALHFFVELIYKLNIRTVYVDSSQVSFIASLKATLGENPAYQEELEYYKHNNLDPERYGSMRVLPISFAVEHKKMAEHSKHLMDMGYVAIHPSLTKLITALRTANFIEFYFQKQQSAHDDIYDSFHMCLKFFSLQQIP